MEALRGSDGSSLFTNQWIPAGQAVVAVVLVAHGMGEYGARYAPLARALNERGIAVFAPDHRGHGRVMDASNDRVGHLADKNGWELLVEDLHQAAVNLGRQYPQQKIFLFGHSMGSLLARRYMQRFGTGLGGVIHSAASSPAGIAARIGAMLALLEVKLIGRQAASKRMNSLLFGRFNRPFRPNRTPYDWISRDEAEVDRYIADSSILKAYSSTFYRDMIGGMVDLNSARCMRSTATEVPILFISGSRDPLGGFGKGVRQVVDQYKKIGCSDVTMKLYPDARHELLQELNRDEVIQDITSWIMSRL